MNHKTKTNIFKLLSILPNTLGDSVYHKLQVLTNRLSIEKRIDICLESFEEMQEILHKENINLADKTVIEIGSGWLPILPYFFIFFNKAKKVVTFDLNKHFNKGYIEKFNLAFARKFPQINLDVNPITLLPNNIQYLPKTDITTYRWENKIDFVFSRNVLEHIPPDIIESIHINLTKGLNRDGKVFHIVSPCDHRAYTDKSLSLYDFLKYSQIEWDNIQTRFDYHNRLRHSDYIDIFKVSRFSLLYDDYKVPKENSLEYKKYKSLQIHNNYELYPEKELLAGKLIFLLKLSS